MSARNLMSWAVNSALGIGGALLIHAAILVWL